MDAILHTEVPSQDMTNFGGGGAHGTQRGDKFGFNAFFVGRTALVSVSYIITIAVSILLLALSFTQVQSVTHIYGGYLKCGSKVPLRFHCTIPNYNVPDSQSWLVCPWDAGNTASRVLAHFCAVAVCVCVLVFVVGPKKNRIAYWVLWIAGMLVCIWQFFVLVNDGMDLSDSHSECIDLAKDNSTSYEQFTCELGPQIALACLNVLFLMWVPNTVLLFMYTMKWKLGPQPK